MAHDLSDTGKQTIKAFGDYMATIKDSMERRIANSRNRPQQNLIKPLLAGTTGYLVFLITLATTYWFTSKPFRYGLTNIDEKDLIISLIGFFALFIPYLTNGTKNTIYRK